MSNQRSCLIIFLLILVSLGGCKRRDPNPHLSDPIYLDILKEIRGFEQLESDASKALEAAKLEFAKSAPRSLDRRLAQDDILRQEARLSHVQQQIEFFKIREVRRRLDSKRKYDAFFEAGEPWPDKKEFEAYTLNKSLNNASRNWSSRVPKPTRPTEEPPAEAVSPTTEP